MADHPFRGDIWFVDLDPVRGREQGRQRPALVISTDRFNSGPAGLVIVLPITSVDKNIPTHIAVDPPEGGLHKRSFVKTEDIRSISVERLMRRLGSVSDRTLDEVENAIVILLDLGAKGVW